MRVLQRLQKLRWWIADYAYAVWWQARALFSRERADSFVSGDRAPVLILPGVFESWRFMLPIVRELHAAGHPVHVVDPLRNNRMPVAAGARIVEQYLVEHDLGSVCIVAHSKGGLVGKHVMALSPAGIRVAAMVAIATPFGGSRYARFLLGSTLRAFSVNDPTVRQLMVAAESNTRIVSVYAEFDPHIPDGSELVGARNVRIDTGGHFRILTRPETLAEIRRAIERG